MSKGLRAGILTIGNEVLDGLVLDTNSNWMEKELIALGVEMRRLVTVRDEVEEIGNGLDFLLDDCDVIITSGGLGPTHDDMTLVSIGKKLKRNVLLDTHGLEIVTRQYEILHQRGIVSSPDITESRKKMAMLPEGSIALDNTVGGAPGVKIHHEDKTIFCLPGVPSELRDIWERGVKPWFIENIKGAYYEEVREFDVVDESVFAPHIEVSMRKHQGVWIKSMPKRYGTTKIMKVWISARGEELDDLKQKVRMAITTLEKSSGLGSRLIEREG